MQQVKKASEKLALLPEKTRNQVLTDLANEIVQKSPEILKANKQDLEKMETTNPLYDRLLLTQKRLEEISANISQIAKQPSPLGKVLEEKTLPNGLELKKITVPLGVIGVIYEARPNVTLDVFALCFKSGNACVLKGGSDAFESNLALISCIHTILEKHQLPKECAYLMPPNREAVKELLGATDWVDVIIPRGSHQLIQFVREHAKVPVIETGAGIVHTYLDYFFDESQAKDIISNAKLRRVSVCNALDTLLVHQAALPKLADLLLPLAKQKVLIFADKQAFDALQNYPSDLLNKAKEEDFGKEFLDYKMSIKTVTSLDEALSHIASHSSKHSEAIISTVPDNIHRFLASVDAAVVYANSSTAFTDGAEFGLGAEIGISTQKLHARGPMGVDALTSYKWVVHGAGQIRAS